ncbi:ATP-binding cassette domain-containing protein [Streptomyces sp. NPDC016459]|uniref:ATP-binding cassette domain-containing protein n=1 Tax=Streptomyces sp. NPDC016459 TaxID=3157190 RepID=UPI003404B82F
MPPPGPRAPTRGDLRGVPSLRCLGPCHPREAAPLSGGRSPRRTGLTDRRTSRIRTLSGGMARRLGIAQALIHDPALLLDEPTAGLDPRQRIALRETIAAVAVGRIVIVSTHLVEDVRGLADRVLILDGGTIAFDGDLTALEDRADPHAPGDTHLERAIATLMGGPE